MVLLGGWRDLELRDTLRKTQFGSKKSQRAPKIHELPEGRSFPRGKEQAMNFNTKVVCNIIFPNRLQLYSESNQWTTTCRAPCLDLIRK